MATLPLTPDELLSTTRAVRRRLDLSRPVEREVIEECLLLAQQAPNGANAQRWHFVVVTDPVKRKALAELYARTKPGTAEDDETLTRVRERDSERFERALSVATNFRKYLHEVPVHVIPCVEAGNHSGPGPGIWASVIPATWSFMLAARARGLGTVWTSVHLSYEEEAAELLGIPYPDVRQAALIPVAYTLGTDFRPGRREPLDRVTHWNGW